MIPQYAGGASPAPTYTPGSRQRMNGGRKSGMPPPVAEEGSPVFPKPRHWRAGSNAGPGMANAARWKIAAPTRERGPRAIRESPLQAGIGKYGLNTSCPVSHPREGQAPPGRKQVCSPLWLQMCPRHICLTRRAPQGEAKRQAFPFEGKVASGVSRKPDDG